MFEEEYRSVTGNLQLELEDHSGFLRYLKGISEEGTHAGYFSIDKKTSHIVDSKLGDRKERTSDDADAYDLIMKARVIALAPASPSSTICLSLCRCSRNPLT
jgi:type III restriction enzyme